MKNKSSFRTREGMWLPEHLQIAIQRALLDFPDRNDEQTHRAVAAIVRRTHPALPISEGELLAAVERVAGRI